MNTPNPLLPQGTLPPRGKSTFYFKVLIILAVHVVVIGGLLMQGCSGKDKVSSTTNKDDTANGSSNSSPMSDLGAATPTTATPAVPASTTTPPEPVANTLIPATTPTPLVPVTPVAAAVPTPGATKDYVIAPHDTLAVIAKHNGVSLKALEDANPGLDPKKLQVGHKLQIPAGAGPIAGVATATDSAAPADATAVVSGDAAIYTVKPGDMLMKIANAHGTTYKKIMALNKLKTTSIKAGQKLKLPPAVMKVASADAARTAPATLPAASPVSATAPAMTTTAN